VFAAACFTKVQPNCGFPEFTFPQDSLFNTNTIFKPRLTLTMNYTPGQFARNTIDRQLEICCRNVQSKKELNLMAGMGIAVRGYQADIGPADYILFVNRKPGGVIEVKREDEALKLINIGEQDLQDFIGCCKPKNRHTRSQTYNPETNPVGWCRKYNYNEIICRDKTSLEISWRKVKALGAMDSLPDPDILAAEIIENLEGGVENYRSIIKPLL